MRHFKLVGLALLVAFLIPFLACAGLINRSTKAGGTTEFATSNSLGNTLQVSDLDTDLDTAYTAINGNIDSNNVKPSGLIGTNLAPQTVTATQLANGAVGTTQLANASVTPTQLAPGAVVPSASFGVANVVQNLLFTTVETTVVTLPAVTVRGSTSHVLITGNWALVGTVNSAIGLANYTIKVKRDGVAFYATTTSIGSSSGTVNYPVQFPTVIDDTSVGLTAGNHTYTITVQGSSASLPFTTPNLAGLVGQGFVMELS